MTAPGHYFPQESAYLLVPPCLFMQATNVEWSVATNTGFGTGP